MFKEIHFSKIPSTHLHALEHLETHQGKSIFISANEQTHGIGRKKAPWIAKGENLLGTFLFPLPEKDSANLAQLLSYSTIKVLEKLALTPAFKWPNDILLSHKKVAGVMAEVRGPMAIISIGMNVNMTKADLDTIDIPATSLLEELHHRLSLPHLKQDLLKQFTTDLTLFQTKGFEPFFSPFASKLAFIGKLAQAGNTRGKIEGLHPDGRLILHADGKQVLLSTSSLEIIE